VGAGHALVAAITSKTRWVILNAPGNPSGALYGHDHLIALSEVLRLHPHLLVMSDEIYAHIRYTEVPYVSIAMAAPDLRDRILLLDGVSKAYAMTVGA
jgi:aspartate aminotransferase